MADSLRVTGCGAAVLTLSLLCVPGAGAAERVEPAGVWTCIVHGDTGRPDERINLVLTPPAATHWAEQRGGGVLAWRRLSDWEIRRRELSFIDARTGRTYTADLEYPTLGGAWTSRGRSGGWWCARRSEDPLSLQLEPGRSSPEFFVPPLVPNVMVSPRYPRQAIREAREGDAIVCFLVDPSGAVRDPEIVEITDQIFAATTLSAIRRTRYRPSTREGLSRPGCRAYKYTLDMIRE